MSRGRLSLGYVVEVDGTRITLNLGEEVRSHVAGHIEGVSSFEQPGDLIAIEAGSYTLVARVLTLSFAEPRELHGSLRNRNTERSPLRQLRCNVIGLLRRDEGSLRFVRQTTRLPALGAQALPLTGDELRAALSDISRVDGLMTVTVGFEARNPAIRVSALVDQMLGRHLAVLGATGQGKTQFVADVLQQLAEGGPKARIIIFDVNGEYFPALSYLGDRIRYTTIGRKSGRNAPATGGTLRLPYYALGRHGLFRLLLPSERSQAPALRFALEHLPFVEASSKGARQAGSRVNVLFDDCRQDDATPAYEALEAIRSRKVKAKRWPHMKALSCLSAEFYALALDSRDKRYKRNAFNYGHISGLVTRINSLLSDLRFREVVDVKGGKASESDDLELTAETETLIAGLFGGRSHEESDPTVHIIDLSQLAQDLMPFVLGSLLESFADQLFLRGPGQTHPTLLVLEEAHHYLREAGGDESVATMLAYERLAKEGRKFGISLLLSTQRPSEVSPTVLAQCGTWAVFRLTSEIDQRAVASAAEDSATELTSQLSGLARGEAMVFGAAFALPIRISRRELPPDRRPDSQDPPFSDKWAPSKDEVPST